MRRRLFLSLLPLLATALPPAARADDPPEIAVVFHGDRFEPAELQIPANTKVALRIENRSAAPMEWESTTLHREKLVPPGKTAKIFIGPVAAGTHEFYDDFHPKIRGRVVVR